MLFRPSPQFYSKEICHHAKTQLMITFLIIISSVSDRINRYLEHNQCPEEIKWELLVMVWEFCRISWFLWTFVSIMEIFLHGGSTLEQSCCRMMNITSGSLPVKDSPPCLFYKDSADIVAVFYGGCEEVNCYSPADPPCLITSSSHWKSELVTKWQFYVQQKYWPPINF